MVFRQLFNSAVSVFGGLYRRSVAKRLKAYGLKYDDTLVETEEVKLALSRLNPALRLERERRIKRAFDLSVKKKTLPEEYQNYDPFERYLAKELEIAKAEKAERLLSH